MFSTCSEKVIAKSLGSVMLQNKDTKKWEHAGGLPGPAELYVYHHPINKTYRIFGRKESDQSVCWQLVNIKSSFSLLICIKRFVISQRFYGGHIHNHVYRECVLKDIQSPRSL